MLRIILVSFLSTVCLSTLAYADQEESPILALNLRPAHVGGYLGLGGLWQKGAFSVDCNCNQFVKGAGSTISFGALYENSSEISLLWGAQLGYEHRSLESRYVLTEDTTLRSLDGKTKFSNVPISFRHTATVNLDAVVLKPYVKWFPIKTRIFLRFGVQAALFVASNKEFHKTLLTNVVALPNDDIVNVQLDRQAIEASGLKMTSDNEVVIQDGPMNDLESFQLSLHPAIGAELRMSKRMFLVPSLEYSIPLGAISTVDTGFATNALQFFMELHYEL